MREQALRAVGLLIAVEAVDALGEDLGGLLLLNIHVLTGLLDGRTAGLHGRRLDSRGLQGGGLLLGSLLGIHVQIAT